MIARNSRSTNTLKFLRPVLKEFDHYCLAFKYLLCFRNQCKRTRSCDCKNCTIYCTGKAVERKICEYVNPCEMDIGNQCLIASSPSETTTSTAETTTAEPMLNTIYQCFKSYYNNEIKSEYRAKFPNGTEIQNVDNLDLKGARRRCLFLGFSIERFI